jgi:NDP-sugar pyrophosphorylase family protein/lipopolysaccharide/colanic/teichoic acid biosynthesis glycosyltransferase
MQALILATGEASRLHPMTSPRNGTHLPAPLLPVLNRPVMDYALELLVRAGLRNIGIAVYNQAGAIEAHFATGSRSGAQLTYVLQREPLGSAGSLRWAASGLKETFVVLPGDAIVDVDICAALAFHQSHGGIATVIVHTPSDGGASGCPLGAVTVAHGGRVTAFSGEAGERSSAGTMPAPDRAKTYAGTGVYIFEPRIVDWIRRLQPARQRMDCHSDLLPELLGPEDVYAYVAEGYWNPLDSIPAYHQAQLDALASATGAPQNPGFSGVSGAPGVGAPGVGVPAVGVPAVRYVSVEDKELAPGILAGRHVSVHPSARLVAPLYIGAGSQIERDVELGPNAVVGANTIVDEGATIRNSTVLDSTYIGRLVNVDGRVVHGGLVVDIVSGESLRVVDPFLLGDVSPHLIVGPMARLLSRAADWAGALLLLLLFLPALTFITLALLLTSLLGGSPGRVVELGPRVRWRKDPNDAGPERKAYSVPHFRTRRPDGAHAPLGAYLERTQLDRLPELFSVLKGDLRLVGVKPLTPSEADRLVEEWQRAAYEETRSRAAGFTGLWYVRLPGAGFLPEADLDEVVATDAYYTATRSLLEDVYLLLSTPVVLIRDCVSSRPREPRGGMRHSRFERRLLSILRRPSARSPRRRLPKSEPGGVGFADSGPTNGAR